MKRRYLIATLGIVLLGLWAAPVKVLAQDEPTSDATQVAEEAPIQKYLESI